MPTTDNMDEDPTLTLTEPVTLQEAVVHAAEHTVMVFRSKQRLPADDSPVVIAHDGETKSIIVLCASRHVIVIFYEIIGTRMTISAVELIGAAPASDTVSMPAPATLQ